MSEFDKAYDYLHPPAAEADKQKTRKSLLSTINSFVDNQGLFCLPTLKIDNVYTLNECVLLSVVNTIYDRLFVDEINANKNPNTTAQYKNSRIIDKLHLRVFVCGTILEDYYKTSKECKLASEALKEFGDTIVGPPCVKPTHIKKYPYVCIGNHSHVRNYSLSHEFNEDLAGYSKWHLFNPQKYRLVIFRYYPDLGKTEYLEVCRKFVYVSQTNNDNVIGRGRLKKCTGETHERV